MALAFPPFLPSILNSPQCKCPDPAKAQGTKKPTSPKPTNPHQPSHTPSTISTPPAHLSCRRRADHSSIHRSSHPKSALLVLSVLGDYIAVGRKVNVSPSSLTQHMPRRRETSTTLLNRTDTTRRDTYIQLILTAFPSLRRLPLTLSVLPSSVLSGTLPLYPNAANIT